MSTLVDRLRDVGCDREPFTPDHTKCICLIANEAADAIERLKEREKSAFQQGIERGKEIAAARLGFQNIRL